MRLSGTDEVIVANNLISMSDSRVFAVDAAADVTSETATFDSNIYTGGSGLRLRVVDKTALLQGFTEVETLGFKDAAKDDFSLLSTSVAVNAGSEAYTAVVSNDKTGLSRTDGNIDVGAFEFVAEVVPPPVIHSPCKFFPKLKPRAEQGQGTKPDGNGDAFVKSSPFVALAEPVANDVLSALFVTSGFADEALI
ncbi:MAG: choice-of-anchor Q domain-containing protein [Beijerinckiaceae bacterium]